MRAVGYVAGVVGLAGVTRLSSDCFASLATQRFRLSVRTQESIRLGLGCATVPFLSTTPPSWTEPAAITHCSVTLPIAHNMGDGK